MCSLDSVFLKWWQVGSSIFYCVRRHTYANGRFCTKASTLWMDRQYANNLWIYCIDLLCGWICGMPIICGYIDLLCMIVSRQVWLSHPILFLFVTPLFYQSVNHKFKMCIFTKPIFFFGLKMFNLLLILKQVNKRLQLFENILWISSELAKYLLKTILRFIILECFHLVLHGLKSYSISSTLHLYYFI